MATATKARRPKPGRPGVDLADQLREIIGRRGLAAYSVGRMAGVAPSVVSRFLSGERGLNLESFDAIAGALGLRLIETGRGLGRRPLPSRPATPPPPGDQDGPDDGVAGPDAGHPAV